MKTTKKFGLMFAVSGLVIMTVNYIRDQYALIFVGTIMLFLGILIPIFLEDKQKDNLENKK